MRRRWPTTPASRSTRSNGAPGVRSARYAGEHASYADNVDHLLAELGRAGAAGARAAPSPVPDGGHGPVARRHRGGGRGDGGGPHLDRSAEGEAGFGYDPVFVPDGADGRTFAEMTQCREARPQPPRPGVPRPRRRALGPTAPLIRPPPLNWLGFRALGRAENPTTSASDRDRPELVGIARAGASGSPTGSVRVEGRCGGERSRCGQTGSVSEPLPPHNAVDAADAAPSAPPPEAPGSSTRRSRRAGSFHQVGPGRRVLRAAVVAHRWRGGLGGAHRHRWRRHRRRIPSRS